MSKPYKSLVHLLIFCLAFLVAILFNTASSDNGLAQDPIFPTPTPQSGWSPLIVTPSPPLIPTLSGTLPNDTISPLAATEYLEVSFTSPGVTGVSTTQEYSGIVTISVSGGGQSAGIAYNDAFYLYLNADGQPIVPDDVPPFHLYINSQPAKNVIIGNRPEYRPDHIYTFNMDVGSTPRRLTFAIGDTYTVDNAGSFTVALSSSGPAALTDSDGDAIWDHWESQGGGIDANGDGTIDLNLYSLGARPNRRDIFLEIDWLDPSGSVDYRPTNEAIDIVVGAFEVRNIALHVILSNPIPATTTSVDFCSSTPDGSCPTGVLDFDDMKRNNFGIRGNQAVTEAMMSVYHYALFVNNLCPSCSESGRGEMPGNDFIVSLGGCVTDAGCTLLYGSNKTNVQAGTLMHELGHNLGLDHGGGDGYNFKPNYLSVMNYHFQTKGIPFSDGDAFTRRFDYSSEELPPLNEYHLKEPDGIKDGWEQTYYACDFFNGTTTDIRGPVSGNGPINWDCFLSSNGTNVKANINHIRLLGVGKEIYDDTMMGDLDGDPEDGLVVLNGYDDWTRLIFNFRDRWDWLAGYHLDLPEAPELTSEVARMLAPDPKVYLPVIIK